MSETRRTHFLTDIIDADIASNVHGGVVATRFPPEPNGFLHIGHAKSICLNFGLARDYGGRCHLRFDDTNPVAEDVRYVESIQADVRWLGFDWGEHLYFASDYFERMYEAAMHLVDKGLAYVDDQSVDEIRAGRGAFDRPGVNSPYRDRSVAENRELLAQMRAGAFPDGSRVLRARIDMAHPNMIMRDPLIYRIRHAHHHRTGDAWCIYPMYDFAHCLEDAIEGITHSICTLEFESNRELYDWLLDAVSDRWPWDPRPHQFEFARLRLGYTVMSKRKLLTLVNERFVEGWDDPRMPTIAGMRRRGYTPEAIRNFAELVGIAKNNSLVDIGKLEHCVRSDLESRSVRGLAVLDPIRLELDGLGPDAPTSLSLAWWPGEPERAGSRDVPLSAQLLVERGDYAEAPPTGWKRMAPGAHVRLFGAFVVRIDAEIRDDAGALLGLRATALPATLDGSTPEGVKVNGVVHWVDAARSVPADVRLYDRLFLLEEPEEDGADFRATLNPNSLQRCADARVEPGLGGLPLGTPVQFVRQGYFVRDTGHADSQVWNRTITLRDSWARAQGETADDGRPERRGRDTTAPDADAVRAARANARDAALAADPALAARIAALMAQGLGEDDADVLAGDADLGACFAAAMAIHPQAASVARWLRHELKGALGGKAIDDPAGLGARVGRLVALVDADAISATAGKRVLAETLATGREPAMLVEELGLAKQDGDAVTAAVAAVLAAHPAEVARYRAGETKLQGFLIGKVMAALRGAGDAAAVRTALLAALAAG